MQDVVPDLTGDSLELTARCPTPRPMLAAVPPLDADRKTPVLPARAYVAVGSRATVTLLTGMNAGHLVSVDGSGVTAPVTN